MDHISQLHDELLLKILSSLPTMKHVMATMVLSKRWQFLWTMMPKLVYDDHDYKNINFERFSRFVDRTLFQHKALAIHTLHFKLSQIRACRDIHVWIKDVEKRSVRELIIDIDACSRIKYVLILPRSLYTVCRNVVTLKLSNAFLRDDVVSFPSLKKLSLVSMKYPCERFFDKLLSGCPILEDLVVEKCQNDNVRILSVRAHHLKSLVLHTSKDNDVCGTHGFVIDTPSLECLDIADQSKGFFVIEHNMSNIVKANIDISHPQYELLLTSVTSAKRLYLCLPTSENVDIGRSVFNRLVCLKICTSERGWLNLLMRVLELSPNLKALKLKQDHHNLEARSSWNEPSSVPECVSSSLETVEWMEYQGTKEEKEVVAFILRNANRLQKVTIKPISNDFRRVKKLKMIKELLFLPRLSPTCQIAFQKR